MIKNAKFAKLNPKIVTVDCRISYNVIVYVATNIINKSLMKN